MDPLSIAGTAAGLATAAVRASAAIYTLIQSTAAIDTTISAFRAELSTLSSALASITTAFQRPDVIRLHKQSGKKETTWGTLFENVERILEDCEGTLARLETALPDLGSRGLLGRGLFRKPIRAFKLNLRSEEIARMRLEVGSCISAMMLTLQMITICVSMDSGTSVEVVGASLHLELAALQRQISEVQTRLTESQPLSGFNQGVSVEGIGSAKNQATTEHQRKTPQDRVQEFEKSTKGVMDSPVKVMVSANREKMVEHVQEHIKCAEHIFSVASEHLGSDIGTIRDVYLESNASTNRGGVFIKNADVPSQLEDIDRMSHAFGSVVGLDESQKKFIHRWIPGTVVGEGAAATDDDEEDFAKLLTQVRYRQAEDALWQRNYADAEILLTHCIAETGNVDSPPSPDIFVIELRVQLAIAVLGQDKAIEAQRILDELLGEDLWTDTPPALRAYLHHSSAEVRLFANDLAGAVEDARKALAYKSKIFTTRDRPFLETVSLLANLLERSGDRIEAETYRHFLPSNAPVETLFSEAACHATMARKLPKVDPAQRFDAEIRQQFPLANEECNEFRRQKSERSWAQGLQHYSLHNAAYLGKILEVNRLIDDGIDTNLVEKMSYNDFTPLHFAILSRELAVVRLLLLRGATVHAQSKNLATPLHLLAAHWEGTSLQVAIAQALIEAGADRTARDDWNYLPVEKLLKSQPENTTDEHEQLFSIPGEPRVPSRSFEVKMMRRLPGAKQESESVRNLLGSHFKEARIVGLKRFPLHYTAWNGKFWQAKTLLQGKHPVNSVDDFGRTPLYWALLGRELAVLQLLLSNGARMEIGRMQRNTTPLHTMAYHWEGTSVQVAITEELIAKGADRRAKDNQGKTPFQLLTSLKRHVSIKNVKLPTDEHIKLFRS